ncbi:hypothetical protein [Pseudoalteromonas rubra]|uniref:hypothetical protein n=1 Tax=Pseudoalteromonas rubra TaxID=43658 RepID=UPI000F765F39|nr:hypothetical protein [Pseudoalteromonas rubra]
MQNNDYHWPEYFPENVPCDSAVPAMGVAYRLVNSFPPSSEDFQMYRDENKGFSPSKEYKKFAYGVSFWDSKHAVQKIIDRYPSPEQFGSKLIAEVNFKADLGMMVVDQPSKNHISLWKQVGQCPSKCVCKEVT